MHNLKTKVANKNAHVAYPDTKLRKGKVHNAKCSFNNTQIEIDTA